MRPLVLAASLAALAGCSMPYEGTSFKAVPKPAHMAEGEHGAEGAHGAEGGHGTEGDHEAAHAEAGERQLNTGVHVYAGDQDDAFAEFNDVKAGRVGAVFPDTAQPSKTADMNLNGYGQTASGESTPAPEPASE